MNTKLTPEARADLLINAMTLDQKIQQMGNLPMDNNIEGCPFTALGRHIEGIPELAIPTMREANGGNGFRGSDCAGEPTKTGGPSMTGAAASFNTAAMQTWGEVVGSETKTHAHQVLLGPGLNLIRTPYAGRAQEYPGEDPYLAGSIGAAQIKGIQSQGTQAMMKHWVGNEHEFQYERWTAGVKIPSRAMHELYLLPFEMAARDAKVAGAMCAYPYVNGEWNCDSSQLMQDTARKRWGWDGWIESDRNAQHSTVKGIKAGVGWELDWAPIQYTPEKIKAALAAGEITMADIDATLVPRYVQMFKFGNFENPLTQILSDDLVANAAKQRPLAEESITLLKNEKNQLPLNAKTVKSIALIGPGWFAGQASIAPRNNDPEKHTSVVTPYAVSPQQGLENALKRAGNPAKVTYNNGSNIASAVALAEKSDAVILMLGTNPREMWDLKKLNLPVVPAGTSDQLNGNITGKGKVNQHDLVWAVLKANDNNVVVLKTGAGVTMNWSHRAGAIVAAWFPGQDDGDIVAKVLFGEINPSGKTPVTWPQTDKEAAFATTKQYPGVKEATPGVDGGKSRNPNPKGQKQLVSYYDEGLAMGYRWYEQNNVKPKYAFGHGLSYTTFAYSDLKVKEKVDKKTGRTVLTAEYRVTNTGKVTGKEASQVYLTLPAEAGQPAKRLVGFSKDEIRPGKSKKVTVVIDSDASNHPFSYFVPATDDITKWAAGDWKNAKGTYTVSVGGASDKIRLTQDVNLEFGKPRS